MELSEEDNWDLIDHVAEEGDAELWVGPLTRCPKDCPSAWREVLMDREPQATVGTLWQPMEDRLPRVSLALKERLRGVGLLRTEEVPESLLYFFSSGGERVEFRGRQPLSGSDVAASRLPDDFLEFYGIHDGFVLYRTESEGPLAKAQWVEGDMLWPEATWQIAPGDCRLSDVVIVFRSGDDSAFGFDTSRTPSLPLLLRSDGTLDVLLDIWTAIDDEMAVILDDCDLASGTFQQHDRRSPRDAPNARRRCERLLKQVNQPAGCDPRFSGAAYYQQWARLFLEYASLEWHGSGASEGVAALYGDALAKWCISMERASSVDPQSLVDWFALACALPSERDAAFLATVPSTLWGDGSMAAYQAYALFMLARGDLERATITMGQLLEQTHDGESTPTQYDEAICGVIESLCLKDASGYSSRREHLLVERPRSQSDFQNWLPWEIRIAGFDAVAHSLGLVTHVARPLGHPRR